MSSRNEKLIRDVLTVEFNHPRDECFLVCHQSRDALLDAVNEYVESDPRIIPESAERVRLALAIADTRRAFLDDPIRGDTGLILEAFNALDAYDAEHPKEDS